MTVIGRRVIVRGKKCRRFYNPKTRRYYFSSQSRYSRRRPRR